jgi:Prolyl oligopeptidase, N-terminal beta-propeller domain
MHMNCCGKTHSRSKSVGTTRSNNRGTSPRNKLEMADTPKVPVSSTYHGVTVAEDYRWLQDPESDQTRSWAKAQDRLTRRYLENLPFRDAVRRRVAEVLMAEPVRYDALRHAGSAYFALKHQPSGNGPPGGSASDRSRKKQPRSIRQRPSAALLPQRRRPLAGALRAGPPGPGDRNRALTPSGILRGAAQVM